MSSSWPLEAKNVLNFSPVTKLLNHRGLRAVARRTGKVALGGDYTFYAATGTGRHPAWEPEVSPMPSASGPLSLDVTLSLPQGTFTVPSQALSAEFNQ